MPNRYAFSRRILIGLFFSCIGDGLLVWREFFLYGMVSFGIGHMFFISAFGFQPLNLSLGIPMYIASMLGTVIDSLFNNRVYCNTAQLLHPDVPAYCGFETVSIKRSISCGFFRSIRLAAAANFDL